MFNTEPPAGARAVPGGECRDKPGRRGEGRLDSHRVVGKGEAWVCGQSSACADLGASGRVSLSGPTFFLCDAGVRRLLCSSAVLHEAALKHLALDPNFLLPFPKDNDPSVNPRSV